MEKISTKEFSFLTNTKKFKQMQKRVVPETRTIYENANQFYRKENSGDVVKVNYSNALYTFKFKLTLKGLFRLIFGGGIFVTIGDTTRPPKVSLNISTESEMFKEGKKIEDYIMY